MSKLSIEIWSNNGLKPLNEFKSSNELKDVVQEELSPSRIKRFGYLKSENVQRLVDLHLSGTRDTHPILWTLMTLLRWNESIRDIVGKNSNVFLKNI